MLNNCRLITPQEGAVVLKRSPKQTSRLFDNMRVFYKKPPDVPINVGEFCEYFRFKIEDVYRILGW